jgi:two-component system sensor histidine kinase ChiS
MTSRIELKHTLHYYYPALLLLLSSLSLLAQSSPIQFDRFSTEEGLSNPYIRCIEQDDRGFMWFGTINGLNRFDGYTFSIYTHDPDDPGSLSDNGIWTIFNDRHGDLWVGTAAGLDLYDKARDRFFHFPIVKEAEKDISQKIVNGIYETSDGSLWIINGAYQLYRFDRDQKAFTHFKLLKSDKNTRVTSWLEDRRGDIWIGTEENDLFCISSQGQVLIPYSCDKYHPGDTTDHGVQKIFEDRTGALQVISSTGKVRIFDRENDRFHLHQSKLAALLDRLNVSPDFLEDKDGNLWLRGGKVGFYLGGGIFFWEKARDTVFFLENDPYHKNSLSDMDVSDLFEDRQGGIWIGTLSGGLNYWNKNRKAFFYHPLVYDGRPETGLPII